MIRYFDLDSMNKDLTENIKAVENLLKEINSYSDNIRETNFNDRFFKAFNKTYRPNDLAPLFITLTNLKEKLDLFLSMNQQLDSWKNTTDSKKLVTKLGKVLNELISKITLKIRETIESCSTINENKLFNILKSVGSLKLYCLNTSSTIDNELRKCSAYYLIDTLINNYKYTYITILVYEIKNKLYYSINKSLVFPFNCYDGLTEVSSMKELDNNIHNLLKNTLLLNPITDNFNFILDEKDLYLITDKSLTDIQKIIPNKLRDVLKINQKNYKNKQAIKFNIADDIILSNESLNLLSKNLKIPYSILNSWINA